MSSENKKNDLHLEKDEEHLLIDHSYDGIQELDNPLPNWWQFTFYGAIVFSVFYFLFYIVLGGPTLRDEFNKDYAVVKATQDELKKKDTAFDLSKYEAIVKEDGIKKGEVVFATNCVPCHKEKGIGDIGPNLTDNSWIHAKGTPDTIYPVVFNGVPDNGMPVWSEVLSAEEIYQVVSYVQTLHNTNQPGGKAPQGNIVEDVATETK
jgi:cytochrome c oxidase cbb3-type subunit 3